MLNLSFTDSVIELGEWLIEENTGRINQHPRAVLMLESDADIPDFRALNDQFDRILVISRDFNDGRIFSLGRQLRLSGFEGQLTLVGELISDQWTALNACGFDGVLTIDESESRFMVELKHSDSLLTESGKHPVQTEQTI
ncbi:MAG: hypothetical protein ACI8XC_004093 [Gammaproteobacteria bacterium]|jgi:uncharacterized protein (DUF934 family)